MTAQILSLNIGHPEMMEWEGKSVLSSMHKHSVLGPLQVHFDRIDDNSFANPEFHGTIDSVLYAFGLTSAQKFVELLGRTDYPPGATGETVTVDHLDETEISVGDIFQFGEVRAQASFPRIPCGKVTIRMQHAQGQKAMQDCGRSGVYFRILQPGWIHQKDQVKRIERSPHPFLISKVYRKVVHKEKLSVSEIDLAVANGAFPKAILEKWVAFR